MTTNYKQEDKERLSRKKDKLLSSVRRIVIKIGSGVLTGELYEDIKIERVKNIVKQIVALRESGKDVAIVSSGAVALGSRKLGVRRHEKSIPVKQASAAIGQGMLISLWAEEFNRYSLKTGQMLLTHDDLSNRRRFLNARNTLNALIDFGVIPIINENDTVAVHEIKFGDNDSLSAKVTNIMEADLLALLSDVDGLYDLDPRLNRSANRIEYVEKIDADIFEIAKDSSSMTGLGGMKSKMMAAKEATKFGAMMLITSGAREDSLLDAILKKDMSKGGTIFFPDEGRLSSKKHWIEFILISKGSIVVDDGAKKAILKDGCSLLGLGIRSLSGEFESGEAVNIVDLAGKIFAKGLVNYHSYELEKIRGVHSDKIESILGYKFYDEIIHRNDMVFFKD